jgi:hypothetical protein
VLDGEVYDFNWHQEALSMNSGMKNRISIQNKHKAMNIYSEDA